MSIERVFLVIGADRKVRASRRPQVKWNEVAIQVNLRFPDTWGRVIATIDADVPDFAPEVKDDES